MPTWEVPDDRGAFTPTVIAGIMRGTGRYNLAQGAVATVQGICASLSGLAAFLTASAAAIRLVERYGGDVLPASSRTAPATSSTRKLAGR